jgi:SAM-dependent methyltransferase
MCPHELHPLVAGFGDAEAYDRGRPVYGEPVARALIEGLELRAGDAVLELGAGTGQLSRSLLAAGLELTAVEPLDGTRALLAGAIGQQRVRAGVAEAIPMPDGCVSAVFAAEAFHWFDETRAMPEIKRVLRPGGGVGILRALPLLEAEWSRELGEILQEPRGEHPGFGARGTAAALEEDPAFGPVSERVVLTPARQTREGLLAYFATISWVATLEPPARAALIARLEQVLERNHVDEVSYEMRHQIWTAQLRASA